MSVDEVTKLCAACGVACAPISKPEDLLHDPHLLHADGMLDVGSIGIGFCSDAKGPLEAQGDVVQTLQRLVGKHQPQKSAALFQAPILHGGGCYAFGHQPP